MTWLIASLLCIGLIEAALRLPFARVLGETRDTLRQALHVMGSSQISDHWKEKAMGAYSGQMFLASLQLAVFLGLLFLAAGAIVIVLEPVVSGLMAFLLGWLGITYCVVFSLFYVQFRPRVVNAARL